jgi:hypothetical protein
MYFGLLDTTHPMYVQQLTEVILPRIQNFMRVMYVETLSENMKQRNHLRDLDAGGRLLLRLNVTFSFVLNTPVI